MILVGIDVAKDKHNCFIMDSDGEILANAFSLPNNKEGFNEKIRTVSNASDKIKVRVEANEHYNYNLFGFLLDKGLPTLLSIHYIPISTEKAYLYERLKRIKYHSYDVIVRHELETLLGYILSQREAKVAISL